MDGARRIRSEKLREHQYGVGYVWSLERKRVEWDRERNVEHKWEQVKHTMIARGTWPIEREVGKNLECMVE